MIGTIDEIHFATTYLAAEALRIENSINDIFVVRNTVVDALHLMREKV